MKTYSASGEEEGYIMRIIYFYLIDEAREANTREAGGEGLDGQEEKILQESDLRADKLFKLLAEN